MEISLVKKYKVPNYPDKRKVIENPKILNTLPERWKDNARVCAALSTLLVFTLTACNPETAAKASAEKAAVAPIFQHGEGRGSFGCMSIAPPSFLSEEEAFQVIQEEAKAYGIVFEKNAYEIENAGIPETKTYLKPENPEAGYKQDGGVIDSTKKGVLQLDGYSEERKIGFEFISQEDYASWQAKQGIYSSVEDYDFLTTAKLLRHGLEGKNGETTIGVFYNPMQSLSSEDIKALNEKGNFDAAEATVKEVAEEKLREQVKDFLQWLKAQGIV